MKLKSLSATIIFAGFATFAYAQNATAESIKLSVSRSVEEAIFNRIKDPFEKESGVQIVYVQAKDADATSYFKDVIDGKADAAVGSQAYETWVEVMGEKKITVPSDITHRVISRDIVQLVANKANGVSKLSLDQVEGIFTGKIKTWKAVGGAETPVTIILYKTKPAKNPSFRKLALHDQKFGDNTKEVPGEEGDIVKAVSTTQGSIAFITRDVPLGAVAAIETPPLGRPVTMITKGPPSAGVQKLIQFIRTNGSKYGIQ